MFGSDVSENITLDMQVRRDSSSILEALTAACTGFGVPFICLDPM